MTLTGNFKDKAGRNEPEKSGDKKDIVNYEPAGGTRNVSFVLPDGKRLFLNYSYLISGEYVPEDGEIKLTFTTHLVTIKGNNLDSFYEGLMAQVPKEISVTDKRYIKTKNDTDPIVAEMRVDKQ